MKDKEFTKGFVCECGEVCEFDDYVFAHWNTKLIHQCKCGIRSIVFQGVVKKIK